MIPWQQFNVTRGLPTVKIFDSCTSPPVTHQWLVDQLPGMSHCRVKVATSQLYMVEEISTHCMVELKLGFFVTFFSHIPVLASQLYVVEETTTAVSRHLGIANYELRWIKEWICSERPITICAIVKAWLCHGSRIWPKCDVTTRQGPMRALILFTLQRNLLANMLTMQLLGYSPDQIGRFPIYLFLFI